MPPLTEQDLLDQRESIQNDLDCILDGIDQKILDNVCQVIVDRFKILIDKLKCPISDQPSDGLVPQAVEASDKKGKAAAYDMLIIYRAGMQAQNNGLPNTTNPYLTNSVEWTVWRSGWFGVPWSDGTQEIR